MSTRATSFITGTAVALAVLAGGSPVAAQSGLDRLQLHGYLTQGYATASDLPIFGIPTNGTVEYRTAALQFRYGLTDKDAAVIQLKHRKLGESPLTAHGADVTVDWAFYHRRLGNGAVKIGRVPLPAGLLNETRAVGTIMPFYRAPGNFYLEGVDAMDGVSGSYELSAGSWSVETAASAGEISMDFVGPNPETGEIMAVDVKLERFVAGQVSLNTPVQGLRVGGSAQRWDGTNGGPAASLLRFSTELVRERYFVRGEYQEVDVGTQLNMYYTHGGLKFGRFGVNGQADFQDMKVQTPIGALQYQSARDLAVGVSFAQSANLVYKLEAHRARGTNFDTFISPMGPKGESDYFIGSVSVSF